MPNLERTKPDLKRNATEVEADRLFILSLLTKSGKDLSIPEVAEALNARRASAAREWALAQGKTEEEAEQAEKDSSLSNTKVATEIASIRRSLHNAIESGAASWLDSQLAELKRDRDQTYVVDEMALAELELSRKRFKRNVRGIPVFGDETEDELDEQFQEAVDRAVKQGVAGKVPQVRAKSKPQITAQPRDLQAIEIIEMEEEMGGPPRFLEILSHNIRRRMELRQEERLLMFGKEWARQVQKSEQQSAKTFANLLTGKMNVEEAEEAVLQAYQQELQQLVLAEQMEIGPSDPSMVRMERLRVERQHQKLRELREYMRLNRKQDGDGPRVIELVFQKVEPENFREVKQITNGKTDGS